MLCLVNLFLITMVHHQSLMFHLYCHKSLPSIISLPLRQYLPVPIESHPIHQAPFLLMKLSTIAMFSLITIRRSTFLEKKQFLFAVVTILPPVLVYGIHIYPYIHKNSLLSGNHVKKLSEMVQLNFSHFKG